jgi:hypothetical protein
MRTPALLPLLALGLGLGALAAIPARSADSAEKPDADKIAKLIKQLGSDDFDDREKASAALDAIGAPALDALRDAAKSSDEEVRKRAEILVAKIGKRAESANALTAKRVHLVYKDTPLADALDDFQKKSGYTIALSDPENKLKDRKITLDTGDATFWQALDQFCDKAGLKEADAQTLPPAPLGPPVGPNPVPLPIIKPGVIINPAPLPPAPAKDQPASPPAKEQTAPATKPAPPPGATQAAPPAVEQPAPATKPATPAGAPPGAPAQTGQVAPGQPAQAVPPAPPVAGQPGGFIGGPVGPPVAGAPGVAAPDQITLVDGNADSLPTDAASAVRIRALAKADQFGPAADGEILLGLRLSLEPKMQWRSVDKVTIKKAVDDQKQELAQTTTDANPIGIGGPAIAPAPPGGFVPPGGVLRPVPLPFPAPGFGLFGGMNQDVAVHLKKGDKAAKSLTELSGVISAQILAEATPIITVKDIMKLKEGDEIAKGGENGQIKIVDVSNNNGQVVIRLELQPPTDVVPANGPNNGPVPVPLPIRRGAPPAPLPPQPANPPPNPAGAAAAPPAAAAPAPGGVAIGIAVAPGGIVVGPGVWGQQGAGGLTLLDDKDNVIKQTGTQIQSQVNVVNNVATVTQTFVLTFQPDKGQEPSKLVYSGRKMLSVEIPFTLKDVPLP